MELFCFLLTHCQRDCYKQNWFQSQTRKTCLASATKHMFNLKKKWSTLTQQVNPEQLQFKATNSTANTKIFYNSEEWMFNPFKCKLKNRKETFSSLPLCKLPWQTTSHISKQCHFHAGSVRITRYNYALHQVGYGKRALLQLRFMPCWFLSLLPYPWGKMCLVLTWAVEVWEEE